MTKRPTDMSTTPTVDAISRLRLTGDIIPPTWYKTITRANGKPHLLAIVILANILYWYKSTPIRDEASGDIVRHERKFYGDKLQRSYDAIADQFGVSKAQATDACHHLEQMGLLTLEFRTVRTDGGLTLSNVLFIEPVVDAIAHISFQDTPLSRFSPPPSPVFLGEGMAKKGETYTSTTTSTTTSLSPEPEGDGVSTDIVLDAEQPTLIDDENHVVNAPGGNNNVRPEKPKRKRRTREEIERDQQALKPKDRREEELFARLQREAKVHGYGGAGQFQSLQQADDFRKAVALLNGQYDKVLDAALRRGIYAVGQIVGYLLAAATRQEADKPSKTEDGRTIHRIGQRF